MGWLFVRGVPPMQSPDENQHIARAYMLGHGDLTLYQSPGKMSGGDVDEALLIFIRSYSRLAGQPHEKMTQEEQVAVNNQKWQGTKARSFSEIPGTGYYLPLIYIPHAVGLRLGEFWGWSVGESYQLVRFTVLLSCLAVLTWAFALHRPSPLVLGLLWLPMSVFQFLMPTLDGFTTSLALLAISLFLWMWRRQDAPPMWATETLAFCLLMVVTSRLHLLPMLCLSFMVFWRWRQKHDLWLSLLLTTVAISWLAYALIFTVDWRIPRMHGTGAMLRHYVLAPWEFFAVLGRTLTHSDLLAFYGRSMVGILGWLDAPLRHFFYPWIGALLLACTVVSITPATSRSMKQARLIFPGIAIASVLLTFFALLVTWTRPPAMVVEGIQGRYFIVPALMLAYSLGAEWKPSGLRLLLSRGALGALLCLSMTALVLGLQDRYCVTPIEYSPPWTLRFTLHLDPLQSCTRAALDTSL